VTRVAQSYAASVSFAALVIGAVSLVVFFYEAFRILAPGVFELTGTRVAAARVLLSALYLAFASAAVLITHRRLLHAGEIGTVLGTDGDVGYGSIPPMAPPTPY